MPQHHHSRHQHRTPARHQVRRTQPAPRSRGVERRATLAVDPILGDFQREPYDPLSAARAAGSLTGHALHQRGPRWVRIMALVVALAFVLSLLFSAALWLRILG